MTAGDEAVFIWATICVSLILTDISSRPRFHGALDPFGSGSFNSAEGFADFSQMSQVKLSLEPLCLCRRPCGAVVVVVLSWLPGMVVSCHVCISLAPVEL